MKKSLNMLKQTSGETNLQFKKKDENDIHER